MGYARSSTDGKIYRLKLCAKHNEYAGSCLSKSLCSINSLPEYFILHADHMFMTRVKTGKSTKNLTQWLQVTHRIAVAYWILRALPRLCTAKKQKIKIVCLNREADISAY